MNARLNNLIAVILLLSIGSTGCSDAGNPARGEVEGVVEQVLHSGVMPSDGEGASRTISPVAGVVVTVTDESGETKTTMTTDMIGRFSGRLPVGTYIFSIPELDASVPTAGKTSTRAEIVADSLVTLSLRYEIYTP